jgi:hypothetical protein
MMFRRSRVVPSVIVAALIAVAAASCGSGSKGTSSSSKLVATDVAAQASAVLAKATHTHGANCLADFDGDGRLDVLLNSHTDLWPLLRGLPDGRFEPYYKGLDLVARDRHGCAVADFNGDGLLDVYIAIGSCKGTCRNAKELWIQRPDHTFVEEAKKWGISDPGGRGRVPVVLDANGDKRPDLFTGQETGVKYPSLNRLWINRGDHFELQTGPITNSLGTLCAAAADIDGDGIDEVALCTPDKGFFIYKNVNGTYVDATKSFGLKGYGRVTVEFVDVNGDGRPDLATVTKANVQIYLNVGGHYGRPVLDQKVTKGKDVAFGDVDGDGDPDMYVVTSGNNPDQVFLNDGHGRKWTAGPELASPPGGSGDSAVAIPKWKGTNRVAFLVNNGNIDAAGARQLWEFSGPG